MKRGQSVDENNIDNFFQQKFCLGQMGHFGPENGLSL